eukprot:SAG11_NODE_2979_length_2795_cov_1.494807_3_plen_83_part_00
MSRALAKVIALALAAPAAGAAGHSWLAAADPFGAVPEPFEFMHGAEPTALPARPASPDPLVRYAWDSSVVSTTLQQVKQPLF